MRKDEARLESLQLIVTAIHHCIALLTIDGINSKADVRTKLFAILHELDLLQK